MDLIKCNTTDKEKCKWLTLTYAEVMTDYSKVFEDGKMFIRKLQRYLNRQSALKDGQRMFKRITVAEPQGEAHDNSWHLHILLIFEETAPYIANEDITQMWRKWNGSGGCESI